MKGTLLDFNIQLNEGRLAEKMVNVIAFLVQSGKNT